MLCLGVFPQLCSLPALHIIKQGGPWTEPCFQIGITAATNNNLFSAIVALTEMYLAHIAVGDNWMCLPWRRFLFGFLFCVSLPCAVFIFKFKIAKKNVQTIIFTAMGLGQYTDGPQNRNCSYLLYCLNRLSKCSSSLTVSRSKGFRCPLGHC